MQRRALGLLISTLGIWVLFYTAAWTFVSNHHDRPLLLFGLLRSDAGSNVSLSRDATSSLAIEHKQPQGGFHRTPTFKRSAYRTLNRRAPTLTNPRLFNTAKERGQKLICAMSRPANAPQTHFSSFRDLEKVMSL